VAADQKMWPGGYAGAEYTARDLTVPAFSPVIGGVIEGDVEERFARAYFYTTLSSTLALSVEYQRTHFFDPDGDNPLLLQEATTHRLPIQLRYFDRFGLIAGGRATYVNQEGAFRNLAFELFPGGDDFWTVDLSLGYRLPRRWGVASLDVRNLFDSEFRFQDTNPSDPTILPVRQIVARVSLTF
jgi:hypothetical protein